MKCPNMHLSVLVAEEKDRIAGWVGWTVKVNPIRNEKYAYIAEVMVHPEFRRRGIAAKLVAEAEKKAKENGASYIYCLIFGPNDSSKKMFENFSYSNENMIISSAISVYNKTNIVQKYKIERINKNEINDVIRLINDFYNGRAHFKPYTPESFEFYINAIPAYGLNNFWVVKEDGKILACAGLWDCSVLQRMCFAKLPLALKIMVEVLVAFIDPNDTLFEIMKVFKPQNEIFYFYAKAFEKELPKFSPLYTDIRDTIL